EKVEESRHEVEAIRDRVLPGARQTLAEVRAGYARGGFSFLDVSTAQRELAAAHARLVQAATRYHQAGVELDRLTGRLAPLVQEAR
ncbi:MAG: TolC family protein, partial [Alphaproteobacteria bacterium]